MNVKLIYKCRLCGEIYLAYCDRDIIPESSLTDWRNALFANMQGPGSMNAMHRCHDFQLGVSDLQGIVDEKYFNQEYPWQENLHDIQ